MKKLFVVLVLLVLATAGVFAAEIGVGAFGSEYTQTFSASDSSTGNSATGTNTATPLDAFVLLSGKFLEIKVGYLKASTTGLNLSGNDDMGNPAAGDFGPAASFDSSYVTAGAFLKLPIDFGGLILYPMGGAEYDYNLTYTDANGNDLRGSLTSQELADLNEIWLKGGLGLQLNFGHTFLALEGLYCYKIATTTDNNSASAFATDLDYPNGSVSTISYEADLMVGLRF